jgi:hypothetical protein
MPCLVPHTTIQILVSYWQAAFPEDFKVTNMIVFLLTNIYDKFNRTKLLNVSEQQ